jgi:hypothetical protein
LDVVQRKLARYTLGFGPRDHVGDSKFSGLSWLPFPKRVTFFRMSHISKIRKHLAPSYLVANFQNISEVHSHRVRQGDVNSSLSNCKFLPGTFTRTAISEWNALPSGLKHVSLLPVFKNRLKEHLIKDLEHLIIDI